MPVIRVAAVNDDELVVAGLAGLLSRFPDRIEVCDRILIGEPLAAPVDLALYDTFAMDGDLTARLRELRATEGIGAVALFTLDLRPDLLDAARQAGIRSFISKRLSAQEIADAVVAAGRGEAVVVTGSTTQPAGELRWPGRTAGLSQRESEAVVLAAQGLSNREIAAALYVGTETVKSYLSQAYGKLGVRNRVEATNWLRADGGH